MTNEATINKLIEMHMTYGRCISKSVEGYHHERSSL